MAVAGMPEPMKNNAAVMVRFAIRILEKMHVVTKELEITLGPGMYRLVH